MYCPSCGKTVPDGSNFCLHCGSSMIAPTSASSAQVEWEYDDYLITWKPGKGGHYNISHYQNENAMNENAIRLSRWNEDQLRVLSEIQQWRDKGWQMVTQAGPGAYSFRRHGAGIFSPPWLEVAEFRVKMRRLK